MEDRIVTGNEMPMGLSAYTAITELRALARELFMVGVRAAEPGRALAAAWDKEPPQEPAAGGRYHIIAFGKAAVAMLEVALNRLPVRRDVEAIAVTNDENYRVVPGARVHAAGHPVPDRRSLNAANDVIAQLEAAGPKDVVVALVSGGGSALLTAPVDGLTLDQKSATTECLLRAGLDISAINAVRQHLSRLKGGGMGRLAQPAPVTAYILSDVPDDCLAAVASGPTVGRSLSTRMLRKRLVEWDLSGRLPDAAWRILMKDNDMETGVTTRSSGSICPNCRNILIGSNRMSLDAIQASRPGFPIGLAETGYSLDVNAAAERMLADAARLATGERQALIYGGETHVTVRGTGLGGRNQELALRFALGARTRRIGGDWVFLSGGTDGRDGPTDSAGAIVDPGSLHRMEAASMDPVRMLTTNDSYPALAASDDHLFTGGTGTNVADIQIFLRG